jgi:hypothetical protein
MHSTSTNRLLLAREKFEAGEIDKYQYAEYINDQHAGVFDYRALGLAGEGRLQALCEVTEEALETNSIFIYPQIHAEVISKWESPAR